MAHDVCGKAYPGAGWWGCSEGPFGVMGWGWACATARDSIEPIESGLTRGSDRRGRGHTDPFRSTSD